MTSTSENQKASEIAKAKVQRHLRLTYEDWKESFKQLRTRSEIGVFYAIRTLDPFGDRALEIDCAALGDELGLHRTTVSDALKLLSEKKLIDLEITKARVKQKISNRRLTLLTTEENGSNQEKKEEKTMRVPSLTCESPASLVSPQPHNGGAALTDERPGSNEGSKPLPQADFKNPHTIQTYSDFSKTTTDSVAADENFVEEEEKKKPTPEEFKEALQEIRRISPEIQINAQVRKAISLYWANLPAAVAHTKKAVQEGWKCSNITGILMKALKDPPEDAQSATIQTYKELPRPTQEQETQLLKLGTYCEMGMVDGRIAYGIKLQGGEAIPWWKALGIPFEQIQ